jgi:membrane fusion protein, peptide pheromone/bacteriocin exporter
MKPIIVDMTDISDSVEVYESKPNPFMIYVIYALAALLIIAAGWMCFSKIDIVVKSNGIFRSNENAVNVSIGINGKISASNVEEGQYVEEGDVLFTIDAESIEDTIQLQETLYQAVTERIDILQAYDSYLNGQANALEAYAKNQYYKEFTAKKEVLELTNGNTDTELHKQKEQVQNELNAVLGQIDGYEQQVRKLQQAEDCVKKRSNSFQPSESYYESIVSSYISNYNVTASKYDNQISEYEKQLKALEQQLKIVSETSGAEETSALEKQITEYRAAIGQVSGEKETTLNNLELQQIAAIEQQIATVDNDLKTAENTLSTLQAQMKVINDTGNANTTDIRILTEQQNVAAELLTYQDKKREYENTLRQYDAESGKATVRAETSGYICMLQDITEGNYIAQGTAVCQILPENTKGYYAEIYVENQDIAKLQEGQAVKFEIAAFPSSEYGYFTGVIESISKDIKADQTSGSAYYLVKVRCDQTTVTNKSGKTGTIINGMACQAKVIVDEKNVFRFLLEKLDLLD